jgi:hypothetical protein
LAAHRVKASGERNFTTACSAGRIGADRANRRGSILGIHPLNYAPGLERRPPRNGKGPDSPLEKWTRNRATRN